VKFFFDDKEKVYNFVNKEVTNENRQYANIKFYMKTMLKDDIYDEAKKMFNVFCNNFWLKSTKILDISSHIIKYISDQCASWKNEYDIAYEENKKIKMNLNNKKLQKNEQKNDIENIIKEKNQNMYLFISKFSDPYIKEIFKIKFDKLLKKINFTKTKFKVAFFNNKCTKLIDYINHLSQDKIAQNLSPPSVNLPLVPNFNPVPYESYLEKILELRKKIQSG